MTPELSTSAVVFNPMSPVENQPPPALTFDMTESSLDESQLNTPEALSTVNTADRRPGVMISPPTPDGENVRPPSYQLRTASVKTSSNTTALFSFDGDEVANVSNTSSVFTYDDVAETSDSKSPFPSVSHGMSSENVRAARQRLATIDVNSIDGRSATSSKESVAYRLRTMSYRERRANQENMGPTTSTQRKLTDGGSVLIRKRAMMPPPAMRRAESEKSPAAPKVRTSRSAVEDVSPVSHYNLRKRHGNNPLRDPHQSLITEFVPNSKHTQKAPARHQSGMLAVQALTMHRCYSETSISSNSTDRQSEEGDRLAEQGTSLSTLDEDMSETCDDRTLVGDRSRTYALPVVKRPSRQQCPGIDGGTLSKLLSDVIGLPEGRTFKVIDCRYPYEYEGGHVKDAVNLYMQSMMNEHLFSQVESNGGDQSVILIFYCEFSQERGPRMFRAVRNHDRAHNAWPKLCYPEMYLLENGYRSFFGKHKPLCTPQSYTSMRSKPDELREMKRYLSEASTSSINRAVTRSVTRQMESISPQSTAKGTACFTSPQFVVDEEPSGKRARSSRDTVSPRRACRGVLFQ